MSNIQNTLDSLQPYVIGIRFIKASPVVDVVLTEGWTMLEDVNIQKVKGDDGMNYYMIFSDKPGIGLDELLAYVERTVKANLDREKKHELLKAKVNELKEIFKRNSLPKLKLLKFNFGEEDLLDDTDDLDDDLEVEKPRIAYDHMEPPLKKVLIDEPEEEEIINNTANPETYLDENQQPIELTEEDREILAEEARAERNLKAIEAKKVNQKINPNAKKVELPPKRKFEMANEGDYESDCDCGPNDACQKCIDKKDY